MKFLKKCTSAEYAKQVHRATEEENKWFEGQEQQLVEMKTHRTAAIGEDARLWQKRHRQQIYDMEIALGERTPVGTKRNRKVGHSYCTSIRS